MGRIRVAINGFGRIGRLTARVLSGMDQVDLVAINDLSDAKTMAHLLKYDSLQGIFDKKVVAESKSIQVEDDLVYVYACKDPDQLPWKDLKIDVVVEATGVFRTLEKASLHLKAGARKVVLSAPPKSEGIKQIVLGVNDDQITAQDQVISNASCTTNCAAPLIAVLDQEFTIKKGILTTVHAYTSDQRIHDAPHRDLRRARAAGVNIIPTTTGASKALEAIFSSMRGKLQGSAIRVPTATGSITELTLQISKLVSAEQINEAIQKASENQFKGILKYNTDAIVSSDIVGSSYSSIFDAPLTVSMGDFVKVSSWYDNEMGYSNRLAELCLKIANQ